VGAEILTMIKYAKIANENVLIKFSCPKAYSKPWLSLVSAFFSFIN
jgi:hypothetical protein